MSCECCGRKLKGKGEKTSHVNIAQPEKEHFFCSEGCKDRWCFRLQARSSTVVISWAIGRFQERYFFVKKHRKTSSPSLVGAEGNKTYFTPSINKIEPLRLKEAGGRKLLVVAQD